jgi:predicted DNA-binding transcriptional regulator AlpA
MQPQPELLHRAAVCALLGGSRPINSATLYRWVKAGRIAKPVKLSPGSSRWLRTEVMAALAAMVEGRTGQ